jgi:hypothetical protein
VAEEWGWRPTGLDIGSSTIRFVQKMGSSVKQLPLEEYSPALSRPDAIFIWNCFEQLEDPSASLRRSHVLLGHHGILVLRVPNAMFYRMERRNVGSTFQAESILSYNNLLGFPYLHGFSVSTLSVLLREHGFEPIEKYGSSVLTPPYPDPSQRVRHEWQAVRRESEDPLAADGAWIEIVSRKREAA